MTTEAARYAEQVRSGVVLSTENLARFIEDQERTLRVLQEAIRYDFLRNCTEAEQLDFWRRVDEAKAGA